MPVHILFYQVVINLFLDIIPICLNTSFVYI